MLLVLPVLSVTAMCDRDTLCLQITVDNRGVTHPSSPVFPYWFDFPFAFSNCRWLNVAFFRSWAVIDKRNLRAVNVHGDVPLCLVTWWCWVVTGVVWWEAGCCSPLSRVGCSSELTGDFSYYVCSKDLPLASGCSFEVFLWMLSGLGLHTRKACCSKVC